MSETKDARIGEGVVYIAMGVGWFFFLMGIGGCLYLHGKSSDTPLITITIDKKEAE